MIALATASVHFSHRIVQANASAIMVGVALVASASPFTHSFRHVQTSVKEMVCV
jgi:hypothetical protein